MFRIHLAISGICLLFLRSEIVVAQDCSFNNCPQDKFCDLEFGDSGNCQECPSSAETCQDSGFTFTGGVGECIELCNYAPTDAPASAPTPAPTNAPTDAPTTNQRTNKCTNQCTNQCTSTNWTKLLFLHLPRRQIL